MAISTLDGALAGMQSPRLISKSLTGTLVAGRPQSLWPVAGMPGAGTYDATINGATLTASVNGQIPFTNPVSGNSYLARFQAAATQPGTLLLLDRLWVNQIAVNNTTSQAITTPTFPTRSADGTSNGDGVLIAFETSAAASATAVAATVTYTNQSGTGSRTATILDATAATATIAGAFFRVGLQAGDTGVRSIQSVQFSTAWTTGTINMVAYRFIAALELPAGLIPNAIDALTSGFPRLYDGSVPFMVFIPSTTTSSNISGQIVITQG